IEENFGGLILAFILAIILVYIILGIQFESFLLPFVIILSIPLALIGVIWGLLITGISINLMSLIGTVVLVGIVVNDSILKLDTIKRLRSQGYDLLTAVKMGGSQRFRPIIMTSLTTIFGLLPLAIGLGTGAELTRPLAIAIITGLIASTLLTLFIIPVIYVLIEKRKESATNKHEQ
ncbi:MAG: efflux RND transporter permease subunit, partial [Candidatus Cloacimonadia bacterium]